MLPDHNTNLKDMAEIYINNINSKTNGNILRTNFLEACTTHRPQSLSLASSELLPKSVLEKWEESAREETCMASGSVEELSCMEDKREEVTKSDWL